MSINFPNTPEKYKQFLETIAGYHKNIEHDAVAAPRFVMINEAMVNPFKGIDMGELIQKQRSILKYNTPPGIEKKLLMVGVEWCGDIKRVQEVPVEYADMAYCLLGKVSKDNWDERTEVMNTAYDAGREIMAWMQEYFALNSRLGQLQDVSIDPIGPTSTDNLYGWRFDWRMKLYKAFSYDTDNFNGHAPVRSIG